MRELLDHEPRPFPLDGGRARSTFFFFLAEALQCGVVGVPKVVRQVPPRTLLLALQRRVHIAHHMASPGIGGIVPRVARRTAASAEQKSRALPTHN